MRDVVLMIPVAAAVLVALWLILVFVLTLGPSLGGLVTLR